MQLLKLASSKSDCEDIADEIYRLREQKEKLQIENANRDELQNRIYDMSSFLQGYGHDREVNLNINEKETSVVRLIFESYLAGYSFRASVSCCWKKKLTLSPEKFCGANSPLRWC